MFRFVSVYAVLMTIFSFLADYVTRSTLPAPIIATNYVTSSEKKTQKLLPRIVGLSELRKHLRRQRSVLFRLYGRFGLVRLFVYRIHRRRQSVRRGQRF